MSKNTLNLEDLMKNSCSRPGGSELELKAEKCMKEVMEKLSGIEKLLIILTQMNTDLKKDVTKVTEHIDAIDEFMAKIPLGWLPFKSSLSSAKSIGSH